ncbi:MAG: hypothetical protein E7186_06510 [Erysipelotrichaceae bacterium]|nr:hypothetical protein [Erysipelotrichaceae bacterium]
MDITFNHTPEIFGFIHLAILAGIIVLSFLFYALMQNRKQQTLIRILGILGLIMVIGEAWKQWFVPRYVYTDGPSAWFFPWQLCSMAMYCSIVIPFLKGKLQDTVLTFLATYSLLAAIIALVLPYDMMRPQIWLFVHGFFYHGIMIIECIAAILILRQRQKVSFTPAIVLFAIMAVIAEVINIISHHIINDTHVEANMFYITPYYPTTQPVFHEISVSLGILPGILIYLGAITAGSYLLYRLMYHQIKA